MRHLLSLVLGLILGPLIYVLIGIADAELINNFRQFEVQLVPTLIALACALVAAGLYSILVLARLSPLGTVLAGLILFVLSVWGIVAFESLFRIMPSSLFDLHGVFTAEAGPMCLVASIPLLLTIFSPRRWRSKAQPTVPAYVATAAYVPAAGAPVYQTTQPAPAYQAASPYQTAGAPSYPAQATSPAPAYQPFGTPPPYTPPTYTPPSYPPADTTITSPVHDPDA
jgi:hypothetical protein